jgi:hypothetical protein
MVSRKRTGQSKREQRLERRFFASHNGRMNTAYFMPRAKTKHARPNIKILRSAVPHGYQLDRKDDITARRMIVFA